MLEARLEEARIAQNEKVKPDGDGCLIHRIAQALAEAVGLVDLFHVPHKARLIGVFPAHEDSVDGLDGHLGSDLARGVSSHAIGDHEHPGLPVHQEGIFVLLSDRTSVRTGVALELHDHPLRADLTAGDSSVSASSRGLVEATIAPTHPSIGQRLINARSETAARKPSFRSAIRYRRCLVPADGFYEWKKQGGGKQPHHITLADNSLFAFAGLWEHWQSGGGEEIESCTILTTTPNELMRTIHNRMPVMLAPEDHAGWLDPNKQDASEVVELLRPFPAELMMARPVGTYVNNPRNEGPRCLETRPDSLFD